jgi:hypothetical protein
MPGYLVTGVRRSGKTLICVGKAKEYIERGCPVATNLDLNLPKLVGKAPTAPVIRMPDSPTVVDFEALPKVDLPDGGDKRNGVIILDECAVWLNAREWSGGDRPETIKWLLHSGKLGWDLMFIVQHSSLVDKQARLTLFDYTVICRRTDRLKIPFLGKLGKAFTLGLWDGSLPRVHVASVIYGNGPTGVQTDTWWYRGADVFGAYNTRQLIRSDARQGNQPVPYEPQQAAPVKVRDVRPKLPRVQALERLGKDDAWATAARWGRAGLLSAPRPA